MAKEAKARIKINKLLESASWRFFDSPEGKANISLETHTKITQSTLDELGENFERTKNGFIDFLLLDADGFPLAVLEAKNEDKKPLDGKEQARSYAKSQNVRFVILSNGNLHYFWDIETGNPQVITVFPSADSFVYRRKFCPNPESLVHEVVEADYVAITQKPDYKNDPRWSNKNQRNSFIKDNKLRFLRPYQLKAIQCLQEAAKKGAHRFLFEMATGTGKTLVSAAIIKLFLRTGNAKRILFLVDRIELEDQAWKNMVAYLKNDYKAVIYKENKDDWSKAEIVVSTVQSLLFNNKFKTLFSPTDFDLVISDEAHRSISGNSRAVFEYFMGYKLGLTATPKNYLKNLDTKALADKDPRALELRQLLDTYSTFGCDMGDPTFRYSLLDGVNDGFLVNPIVVDARTEITTQLLSEKGYSVLVKDEEGELQEKTYFQKDFERNLFSEETNRTICKAFIERALKDPVTGEIGKTIFFCVSQNHASKITQILNELAHICFPGKYQSDFAVQITSNIESAQQMTINFVNNNLNGHTIFNGDFLGYLSSKTRICVTVGMMTTGYDCEDILNLCLCRPIFSPSDFVQMKGRGTRKYLFAFKERNDLGEEETLEKEKKRFKLFDYFANCEYFEEHFNYDEKIELPQRRGGGGNPPPVPPAPTPKEYENFSLDPLSKVAEVEIGAQGMRIDRKLFEKFEEKIKANEKIRLQIEQGRFEEAEAFIRDQIFDRPEDYFNLDKLRKSLKLDRRISLREILDKIFGQIKHFKTKEELLEDEVQKFISIYTPQPEFVQIIGQFMRAYILDAGIREIVENKEYGYFATNPRFNMSDFRELDGWCDPVVTYIKDYVSLNAFMN